MIINDSGYRRNRHGDIIKRQKIKVSCDRCGKIKETLYGEYKRRVGRDKDYCKVCSNILGVTGCKGRKSGYRTKIQVSCKQCGKKILRYRSHIKKYNNIFCSQECNVDYEYKNKYGYLLNRSEKNINELCYLMGVILGDGTITNIAKRSKRISIFCDSRGRDVINIMRGILDVIGVNYSINDNGRGTHCKIVSFSLPNEILSKFGMLFCGDKFKANPSPNEKCTDNINFAIGLFNSDGYFIKRSSNGCRVLSFNNTVKSIVESLEKCLKNNSIHYRSGFRSRQRENWKDCYNIYIERQSEIKRILGLSSFPLRTIGHTK